MASEGPARLERELTGDRTLTVRCGAKRANSEQTCRRMAGAGTTHTGVGRCSAHGGSTTSGRKAAGRAYARTVADQIKMQMTLQRLPYDVSAEEALLEELGRTAGFVRWLEVTVGAWTASQTDVPFALTEVIKEEWERSGSMMSVDTQRAEWLRIYQSERQHLIRCARACIDANISERLVRLEEEKAVTMVNVMRLVLTKLGLADDPRLPMVIPAAIREITGQVPA